MQVLVELPVHVDSVFVPNRPYRKWRVLLQTACACSLLMDLLQMRTVGASPLFISEPEAFLAAYQGIKGMLIISYFTFFLCHTQQHIQIAAPHRYTKVSCSTAVFIQHRARLSGGS